MKKEFIIDFVMPSWLISLCRSELVEVCSWVRESVGFNTVSVTEVFSLFSLTVFSRQGHLLITLASGFLAVRVKSLLSGSLERICSCCLLLSEKTCDHAPKSAS